MRTVKKEVTTKILDKFWDDLTLEWFKVEILQDYSTIDDSPSLQAWLGGDKPKSLELIKQDAPNNPWGKKGASKPIPKIRLHVVEEPLTDYLQWEIEVYKIINIPLAREKVYLVPKNKTAGLSLPDGDFMIFDRKRVIRNYYNEEAHVYQMDIYDEKDDISNFLHFKEELMKVAEPVED